MTSIQYFRFEEDFMEDGIRCIPMIVRLKLDLSGVKLKLAEWCRFSVDERSMFADLPCVTEEECRRYKQLLVAAVQKYTGMMPSFIPVVLAPVWTDTGMIYQPVNDQAAIYNRYIMLSEWRALTDLQRFALVKLCRPGHENKNFIKAMNEFALTTENESLLSY